jgi:hypothetical protein
MLQTYHGDDDFRAAFSSRRVQMRSRNESAFEPKICLEGEPDVICPAPDSRASELGRVQTSKKVGTGTSVRAGACPHPTGFILLLRALHL